MIGRCCILSVVLWAICTSAEEDSKELTKHEQFILTVKNTSNVHSPVVWKAMGAVERFYFLNKDFMNKNSSRLPVHVGYGYYCETPHLAAHILESMEPYLTRPHSNILEVGTGSGYLTACMNEILHKQSSLCSLEINMKLMNRTIKTLQNYYTDVLRKPLYRNQTVLLWWNGKRGIPSRSPFDAVYYSGLISDVEYNKIMYQIKPLGILVGFDWDYEENGQRILWLKRWFKPSDVEVRVDNLVKCKYFYRELMKNKGLLKLNDVMGGIAEDIHMNKHGRVLQRDEWSSTQFLTD